MTTEQPPPDLASFLSSSLAQYWWWVGLSLALLALALIFRHSLRSWLAAAPARWGILLVVGLILTVVSLRATPTGDEPHYLIMTQSLIRDGDLDLRNNYEQMHYLEYYPGPLSDSHVIVVGEQWYPVHGVGVPVLAVPWYAIGGRAGVVAMLVLMTVVGIRVMWSALRRAGLGLRAAGIATLAGGLTLPLASLSGQVYPEVPAFLLVALALHAMLAPTLTRWDVAALVVSAGLLPWLHPKFAVLAVALLLASVVVRRRPFDRRLAAGAAALVVSAASLAALFYAWYGAPLPPNIMPRVVGAEDWVVTVQGHFFRQPAIGLSGALFDQQYGLFLASPVHVLLVPGVLLLWRRHRPLAIACAMIFMSVYLLAGIWGDWHGGWSSPARLLAPVMPVVALGIGAVLQATGAIGWRLFAVLAVPSFVHAYLMTTLPDFTRYGDHATYRNYFLAMIERFAHIDLLLVFPSLENVSQTTWLTLLIYVLGVALLTVVVLRGYVGRPSVEAS